jgi:hypothetical protein
MKSNGMIYTPLGLAGFEICQPVSQEDFETINLKISGLSQKGNWKPLKVKIVKKDQGKALAKSDSPWIGSHTLIFRERVVRTMRSFLEKYGELLPLEEKFDQLFIYNPWLCENALDSANSEKMKLSSGKIIRITKYAFYKKQVDGLAAFKISDLRVSPVFLGQAFVDEWLAAGFTGLEFKEIWKA